MFQIDLSQFDSAEAASDYVTKMLQAFEYAITDADVGKTMNTLTEEIGKALSGESFDQEALLESWAFLTEGDNSLLSFLNRLSEESGVAVETLLDNLMQSVTGVEDFSQRVEDAASGAYTLTETLAEGAEAASAYANAFGEMGSEAENTQKQFDASMASVEKCNRQIETLGRQKTAIQQVKELAAQLKSCEKNGAEYNRVAEQLRTKCKAAGISTAALGKNFEGLDDAITAADQSVDDCRGQHGQRPEQRHQLGGGDPAEPHHAGQHRRGQQPRHCRAGGHYRHGQGGAGGSAGRRGEPFRQRRRGRWRRRRRQQGRGRGEEGRGSPQESPAGGLRPHRAPAAPERDQSGGRTGRAGRNSPEAPDDRRGDHGMGRKGV